MTGELLAKHQPYGLGLGVKQVKVSPNQFFMTVAFFDTKVNVYNALSQKEIITLDHVPQVNLSQPEYSKTVYFKEEQYKENVSGIGYQFGSNDKL